MKGLTERQHEIAQFLKSYRTKQGYSPSYREIMEHFGFSSLATVSDHLKALQKKGVIDLQKYSSRSTALTDEPHESSEESESTLSYIGIISSGESLELFSDVKSITVPAQLVENPESSYVIKASGTGLQEEFIDDGDLLIIETGDDIDDGETALVSLNGASFIKTLYFDGEHVILVSRKPNIDPMTISRRLVQIQGKLAGLIRVY